MNKTTYTLSILLLIALCISQAAAFGITPSKRIVAYDTEQHIITSKILNNEGNEFSVHIEAHGDLARYIYIAQPDLSVKSTEREKEFTYVMMLPDGLEPGPNMIGISVSESSTGIEGNHVGGLLSLTQQLQINVPYKGRYTQGFLSVYASDITDPVNVLCEIISMGDEQIAEISGYMEIKDLNNETVHTKEFETYHDIQPSGSARLEDSFTIEKRGNYNALCHADYDGKQILTEKQFVVGSYNFTITDAKVNNFRLGTIAKLDIDLLSDWNSPIYDVYGEITIKDRDGLILRKANLTKTIVPNINRVTAYLDTTDLLAGEYIIGIRLYAGSQVISREYRSIISENRIDIMLPAEHKPEARVTNNQVIAVILVLSALILITLLAIRQNKKLYK